MKKTLSLLVAMVVLAQPLMGFMVTPTPIPDVLAESAEEDVTWKSYPGKVTETVTVEDGVTWTVISKVFDDPDEADAYIEEVWRQSGVKYERHTMEE